MTGSSEPNVPDGSLAELLISAESQDVAHLSAADKERLRVELINWRDAGNLQGAVVGFRKAHAMWPSDPSFPLELLIVLHARGTLGVDGLTIASSLNPDCRSHPPLALLIALARAQAGQVEEAREAFASLASDAPLTLAPFLGYFIELGQVAITDIAVPDARLDELLAGYLIMIDRYGRLEDVMRGLAFFNTLKIADPMNRLTKVLLENRHGLSQEGRAVLVMMLNAGRRYLEARTVVLEYIDVVSPTSPALVKAAATTAISLRDGVLERRLLASFDPDLPDGRSLDRLKRSELARRREAIGADRPIVVFLGFFGQMREVDRVLPNTIANIGAELASSKYGPFEIAHGLATWRKSGNRHLRADQSIAFFAQLVADEAKPLLTAQAGVTGGDAALRFPNLIAALLSRFSSANISEVTRDGAAALMPPGSSVFVDDEAIVEEAVGQTLDKSGVPFAGLPINQFKMWSRIARLRDAIAAYEERTGKTVDVCVLLRTDFDFMYGVFGHLVCRAWSPYSRSVVFGDHDPHAEYIEGLGDRYMAFHRQVFDRVFSVYQWSLDALASTGDEAAGRRTRLYGHEALPALMFEHGAVCEPTTDLAYDLSRGLLADGDLLAALISDHAAGTAGELQGSLQNAIAALKTRLGVS